MRPAARFLLGVAIGGGGLLLYTTTVGVHEIYGRTAGIDPRVIGLLLGLVVAEGLVDGIGVWASVRPLGDGLDGPRSVQFALAGDFFDILSPAGSASSEPIMAQFIGVATDTTYSEALGVRGVAKYVKAAGQLFLSATLGAVLLAGDSSASPVLVAIALGLGALVAVGVVSLAFRPALTAAVVRAITPVISRLSRLYRADPHDRETVRASVDRFWDRIAQFRSRPGLLGLIVLAGVTEQLLVAVAIWGALAGIGTGVALLPILIVVPLPQAATVVPIPASLGTYDVLLGGAVALTTGAPAAASAAAVLLFRTSSIAFGVSAGGLSVAFLRWRRSSRG